MDTNIVLQEADRNRLDDIVVKMQSNGESDDDIRLVVNDFKSKYGKADSAPTGSGSSEGAIPTINLTDKEAQSDVIPVKADITETSVITRLRHETAKRFSAHPDVFSNPKNRDIYYNTLKKNFPADVVDAVIGDDKGKTYDDIIKEPSNAPITNPNDIRTDWFKSIADVASKSMNDPLLKSQEARDAYWEKISMFAKTPEDKQKIDVIRMDSDPSYRKKVYSAFGSMADQTPVGTTIGDASGAAYGQMSGGVKKALETPEAYKEAKGGDNSITGELKGVGGAMLNAVVGTGEALMGASSIFIPALAGFNVGSAELEKKAPNVAKWMSPVSALVADKYSSQGEAPPKWLENAGAVFDFALFVGAAAGIHKGAKILDERGNLSKEIASQIDNLSPEEIDKAMQMGKKLREQQEAHTSKVAEMASQIKPDARPIAEKLPELQKKVEQLHGDMEAVKGTPAEPIIQEHLDNTKEIADDMEHHIVTEKANEAVKTVAIDNLSQLKADLEAQASKLSDAGKEALQPQLDAVNQGLKDAGAEQPKAEETPTEQITEVKEEVRSEETDGENNTNIKVTLLKKGEGHTKGVFVDSKGNVYKSLHPTIAKQGEDKIFRREALMDKITNEHKILSQLQDNPSVVKVGDIVNTSEGRAFKIEKLSDSGEISYDEYREIENAVNDINRMGIEIGDKVSVMRNSEGKLVLNDFSTATDNHPRKGYLAANDSQLLFDVEDKLNRGDKDRIKTENKAASNRYTAIHLLNPKEESYSYLLTQRPPSIGTHPVGAKISEVMIGDNGDRLAWKLTYEKPLSHKDIHGFELTPLFSNHEYLGKIITEDGVVKSFISDVNKENGTITTTRIVGGKEITKKIGAREFNRQVANGDIELIEPKSKYLSEETPTEQITEVKEEAPQEAVQGKEEVMMNDSWTQEFERAKKEGDTKALDILYNKVKVALNGIAQSKGEATVKAFEGLKKDIEQYAEEWKKSNKPSKPTEEKTPELPKSHKGVSDAIVKMHKDNPDALENVALNWNDTRVTVDWDGSIKFKSPIGRDAMYSKGKEGGVVSSSKKAFIDWLASDEPFSKKFSQNKEWVDNINSLRESLGIKDIKPTEDAVQIDKPTQVGAHNGRDASIGGKEKGSGVGQSQSQPETATKGQAEKVGELKLIDKTKDVLDEVTDEKIGERKYQDFSIDFEDGARAFGKIEKGVANISGINAPKENGKVIRGTKTYQRVIEKLKEQGVKSIKIKLQSEDSQKAIDKLVADKVLTNPRDITGSSGNERATTYDINKKTPPLKASEAQRLIDNYNSLSRKDRRSKDGVELLSKINAINKEIGHSVKPQKTGALTLINEKGKEVRESRIPRSKDIIQEEKRINERKKRALNALPMNIEHAVAMDIAKGVRFDHEELKRVTGLTDKDIPFGYTARKGGKSLEFYTHYMEEGGGKKVQENGDITSMSEVGDAIAQYMVKGGRKAAIDYVVDLQERLENGGLSDSEIQRMIENDKLNVTPKDIDEEAHHLSLLTDEEAQKLHDDLLQEDKDLNNKKNGEQDTNKGTNSRNEKKPNENVIEKTERQKQSVQDKIDTKQKELTSVQNDIAKVNKGLRDMGSENQLNLLGENKDQRLFNDEKDLRDNLSDLKDKEAKLKKEVSSLESELDNIQPENQTKIADENVDNLTDAKAANFTEGKALNSIYSQLKDKYGDKKGSSIYDTAVRLVNPNKNEIIEVRSNGVVVKDGDNYSFKPFTNTDFNPKKWELGNPIDVTNDFNGKTTELDIPSLEKNVHPDDLKRFQQVAESLREGEQLLKSGKDVLGKKLTPESRASIEKAVESAKKKLTDLSSKASAKKKVTDIAEKVKKALSTDLPEGTEKMGIGVSDVIDGAVKVIHASIDAGYDIKEAIEKGIAHIRDNWDAKFGELPEERIRKVFEGEDFRNYSIRNERTTRRVEELGMKEAFDAITEEAERSWGEAMNMAEKAIEDKKVNPSDLAKSVINKPRPLTDVEDAILLRDQIRLENERERLVQAINETTDPADLQRLRVEKAQVEASLYDNFVADKIGGRETARGLNARKMLADRKFSLVNMENELRAEQGGKPLTPEQQAKVDELHKDIKEKAKKWDDFQADYEKYLKEHKDPIGDIRESIAQEKKRTTLSAAKYARKRELANKFRGRLNDITNVITTIADKEFREYASLIIEESVGDFKTFAKEMINTVGKGIKEHLPKLYKELGGKEAVGEKELKATESSFIGDDGKLHIPRKLIRDLVESGLDNINDVTDAVHEMVVKELPDATKREVRDAISDYGKTLNLSKEQLDVKVREVRRIGRLVSALEDVQNKMRPLRSGLQRDKLSDEARRLQQQINELMKDFPADEAEVEKKWKNTLDAAKTRVKNQISDIDQRITDIQSGKTPEKTERKVFKGDDELTSLKDQRDQKRKELDALEGKKELSYEQRVQNAISASERRLKELKDKISSGDIEPSKRAKITSPELEAIREQVKAENEHLKELQKDAGIADKIRNENYRKAIQKRIDRYHEQIKNKDFSIKKKEKPVYDEDSLKLQAELQDAKDKWEQEKEKARLENMGFADKAAEKIVKYSREGLLTGMATLGKLASFATERQFLIRPLYNVSGEVLKLLPAVRRLADLSPTEGGFNAVALGENYATFFRSKTYKEALQKLQKGKSPQDLAFGNHKFAERPMLPTRSHGAIKHIAFSAESNYVKRAMSDWLIKNGQDPNDPIMRQWMGAYSYAKGLDAIYLGDSKTLRQYQMQLRVMNERGGLPKLASYVARVLFPIVKVPYNFGKDVMVKHTPYQLVKSIREAYSKDIEKLTPEEKDAVMLNMKKGLVGTTMLFLGWKFYENYGGNFTRETDKDKKNKAGDIVYGDVHIPHAMAHNAIFEANQIGATMHYIYDNIPKDKAHQDKYGDAENIGRALLMGGLSEASKLPFVGEMTRGAEALNTYKGVKDYAGQLVGSRIVPRIIQEVGEWTDPKKRIADGFMENIESKIPFVRKTLPEKQEKKPASHGRKPTHTYDRNP